ncbi:MAG TPA: succinate dehydrogenase, hydrophobic membrane anchor protein [Gammaproteobacteria bacterium]|nr:succinate dehydrogenase, hydrophobic membrane anchor protein [Gammaproteobacteria bacterium]
MSRRINGLQAWALQRFSAVFLIGFSLYVLLDLSINPVSGYSQWRSWLGQPLNSVLIMLASAMLLIHAWVGIRDVIMDYIHPLALRVLVLSLFALGLLASAAWLATILIKVLV